MPIFYLNTFLLAVDNRPRPLGNPFRDSTFTVELTTFGERVEGDDGILSCACCEGVEISFLA